MSPGGKVKRGRIIVVGVEPPAQVEPMSSSLAVIGTPTSCSSGGLVACGDEPLTPNCEGGDGTQGDRNLSWEPGRDFG